ncbi:hypothetical protein DVH05_023769 [Phytophthora capsici]|nr:hypothetical protein DVH05_023769 [Phytophthora capsici]
MAFPVFKSCAVALLKIISRRSVDWAISNKWISTTSTVNKKVTRTAPKELNKENDEEAECVAKEEVKSKWTINPRYLDYERTWMYSSKRQENLERRRLHQRKR